MSVDQHWMGEGGEGGEGGVGDPTKASTSIDRNRDSTLPSPVLSRIAPIPPPPPTTMEKNIKRPFPMKADHVTLCLTSQTLHRVRKVLSHVPTAVFYINHPSSSATENEDEGGSSRVAFHLSNFTSERGVWHAFWQQFLAAALSRPPRKHEGKTQWRWTIPRYISPLKLYLENNAQGRAISVPGPADKATLTDRLIGHTQACEMIRRRHVGRGRQALRSKGRGRRGCVWGAPLTGALGGGVPWGACIVLVVVVWAEWLASVHRWSAGWYCSSFCRFSMN